LQPDVVSLNASISACEKTSHWQRAIDLLLHTSRRKDQSINGGPFRWGSAAGFGIEFTLW